MVLKSWRYRNDPLFLRNEFQASGSLGMPLIRKQNLKSADICLLSCADARSDDSETRKRCGIHFFTDDYRFTSIYNNPAKSLRKYSQYEFLLTPDYSVFPEMEPWRQIESVAHSRWCGAYWQKHGLTVYPTVSWSTPGSYDYCFDAIEKHCTVAVGMIGCKRDNYRRFMQGYNEMLRRIEPSCIICIGAPFPEMKGNLLVARHYAYGKEAC